jgi:hypothetical protein
VTLLSIFDAVEAMFQPLQPAARSCAKLALERLPTGGYAGIADEPFFRVSFGHILRQMQPVDRHDTIFDRIS